MPEYNLNFESGIHAEIVAERNYAMVNSPLILDPITKSYSNNAPLVYYHLEVVSLQGIKTYVLLQNGKNSRFSAQERGSCVLRLTVRDKLGNEATDEITLNVG